MSGCIELANAKLESHISFGSSQGKVRKAEKEEHGDSCEPAMIEKLNLP